MKNSKLKLDPRVNMLLLFLIGISIFFMNKEITSHLIFALCAIFLIFIKERKSFIIHVTLYIIFAFSFSFIDDVKNINVLLLLSIISFIVQKVITLSVIGTFFTKSMTLMSMISAMEKMRFPKEIIIPFTVMFRFFPTLKLDYQSLRDNLKTRGVITHKFYFLFQPLKVIEYLLVPIMIRSLKVAEDLSASVLVRGIENKNEKTNIYKLKFRAIDYLVVIITCIILAVIFYIQFT